MPLCPSRGAAPAIHVHRPAHSARYMPVAPPHACACTRYMGIILSKQIPTGCSSPILHFCGIGGGMHARAVHVVRTWLYIHTHTRLYIHDWHGTDYAVWVQASRTVSSTTSTTGVASARAANTTIGRRGQGEIGPTTRPAPAILSKILWHRLQTMASPSCFLRHSVQQHASAPLHVLR